MSLVALEVQRHGSYKGCGEKKKRKEGEEEERRKEREGRRKKEKARGERKEKREEERKKETGVRGILVEDHSSLRSHVPSGQKTSYPAPCR